MPSELTYPKGPEDSQGIIDYAERVAELGAMYHLETERSALRNILFYLGHQRITYDEKYRIWRPRFLRPNTPYPITNRVAPLVNTAVSNVVSYKVPLTYSPATQDPVDIAAAGAADQIEQIIEKESQVRGLKKLAARWLILTGNVFLVSNYDRGEELQAVQMFACQACGAVHSPKEIEENSGVCPECESEGQWGPALLDGQPQQMYVPKGGRHYTEIENIFTTFFDYESPTLADSPYFMVARTRSKDWLIRVYGEEAAEKVAYGKYEQGFSRYLESLAFATPGGAASPRNAGGYDSELQARVKRIWIKPRQDRAPDGIYAVIAGNEILESGPWKYHDEQGKPLFNVTHIPFDEVPGRILGKTRVDDLIPKQEQRNRLEAMLEVHTERMQGKILLPNSASVHRIAGEPGQVLRFDALPGVPPPAYLAAPSPPVFMMDWIARIDSDMDTIMGTLDVGRGEAPFKGASYALAALLDERQQQGQSALQENWALGWMDWSRVNLNIWREYATEERTLSTGIGQWAAQKFSQAQLVGGVDLDVEIGMNQPRSGVARRAIMDQLVRLRVLNPFDPLEKFKILQSLGVPELMPDYKLDQDNSARENDLFAQAQTTETAPPPPMPWDNHPVHLANHRRFILDEKFRFLPPEVQELAKQHTLIHFAFMSQSAMMGGGQGAVAPKPGGEGHNEKAGEGQSSGTDQGQLDAESQGASPDTNSGFAHDPGM